MRLEVCFTVFQGGPVRVEELRLSVERADDAECLTDTEFLALAPVLILVLRKQIPSLAEQRGGWMVWHDANIAWPSRGTSRLPP